MNKISIQQIKLALPYLRNIIKSKIDSADNYLRLEYEAANEELKQLCAKIEDEINDSPDRICRYIPESAKYEVTPRWGMSGFAVRLEWTDILTKEVEELYTRRENASSNMTIVRRKLNNIFEDLLQDLVLNKNGDAIKIIENYDVSNEAVNEILK